MDSTEYHKQIIARLSLLADLAILCYQSSELNDGSSSPF